MTPGRSPFQQEIWESRRRREKLLTRSQGKQGGRKGYGYRQKEMTFCFSSGFKMFIIDIEINCHRQDVLQTISIGGTQLL